MESNQYPVAEKCWQEWQCGNHMVQDPYLYMQNAKDVKVSSWVTQENEYTNRWFHNKGLEDKIHFLKNKKRNPFYSGITESNGVLYASQSLGDGSMEVVLLHSNFEKIRTLLNRQMLDDRMQVFEVSPCPANNKIVACSALKDGAARLSVIVRDVENETTLAELDGTFSFSWSSDGKYVYSTTAEQREDGSTKNSVVRWECETGKQETVYTWPGHAVFLQLEAAPAGGIFVHVCKNYHDTELVFLDSKSEYIHIKTSGFSKINYIGSFQTKHYFLTDEEASLGKIVFIEEQNGVFSEIKEVIGEGVFPLEGAAVAGNKLLLLSLEDAACKLEMYGEDGTIMREIELPDSMGSLSICHQHGAEEQNLYFSFESFRCPKSILKYDIASETLETVYQVQEPTEEKIVVERKFVTARDEQQILAFLVYREGTVPNKTVPTLMYGYGGYSASQLPWYNNPFIGLDIPDWVVQGGLYVHCILRGGEEYGSKWHEAGCKLNKKNVFYDFIDIAKAVMQDGWTTPEHTAICGGSNGGLLVTALMTMEPSLWKCVIASVPHTDMLHFSLDDRGPMYVTEYGDPRTDEYFEYMKSYSPYHNIHEGTKYPCAYIQTGEQDNNVPPYHGKKFAAAMQQASTGGDVLLRVLAKGSHDRGSGEVFYQTTAEMQIFIEYALGMRG
mgnify:FL=1